MLRPALVTLLSLPMIACLNDESIAGYAPGLWRLTQMNEAEVTPLVTLDLSTAGEISGRAPCNTYSAQQTAPYPWFEVQSIAATRAACPELELEGAYFAALERMTLAEVSGPVLILSNEVGEALEYRLIPPQD